MVFVKFHDFRYDAKFEMDIDFAKFKSWIEMGQFISGTFNIEPSKNFRLVANSGSTETSIFGLEDIESYDILTVILNDKPDSITKSRQADRKISDTDTNCICCKDFISNASVPILPSDNVIELVLNTKNNSSCSKILSITKSNYDCFQYLIKYVSEIFRFYDNDVHLEYDHKVKFSNPKFCLKLLFSMGTANETIPAKITPDLIIQSVLNAYDIKLYTHNTVCSSNALQWPFYCETLQDFENANQDLREITIKGGKMKVWIPEPQLFFRIRTSDLSQAFPSATVTAGTVTPNDVKIINYFQLHYNMILQKVDNQAVDDFLIFNCDNYSTLIQFIMHNNVIRIEGILFEVSSSISQFNPATRLSTQLQSSNNNNTSSYGITFSMVNMNETIPSKVTPENIILALQNAHEINIQRYPSEYIPNTSQWNFFCTNANDFERVREVTDPIIVKGIKLKVSITSTKLSLYFNYDRSNNDSNAPTDIIEFYHQHYHINLIKSEEMLPTTLTNNSICSIHLLCENYENLNKILKDTSNIKIKNTLFDISTAPPLTNTKHKPLDISISEELTNANQLLYNGTIIVSSKSKKEILIQSIKTSELYNHPYLSLFISLSCSYAMLIDAIINLFSLPKATRLTLFTKDNALFLHIHMSTLVDGSILLFEMDNILSEELRVTVRDHNNHEFMIELPVKMGTEGHISWLLTHLKLTGLATVSKYGSGRPLTAFDVITSGDVLLVDAGENPVQVEHFNMPDIPQAPNNMSIVNTTNNIVLIPVEVFLFGLSSSSGLTTDINLYKRITLEECKSLLLSPWKSILGLPQSNIRTKIILGKPIETHRKREITSVEILVQAYEENISVSSTGKSLSVTIVLESSAVIVFVSFIKLYENGGGSGGYLSICDLEPMVIDRNWNWMKVLVMIVGKLNPIYAIKIVSVTSSDGVYHNDCRTLRTGDEITIVLDIADQAIGVEEIKVDIKEELIVDNVDQNNIVYELSEFEISTSAKLQEFGVISLTHNQLRYICSKFGIGTDFGTIVDYYFANENEINQISNLPPRSSPTAIHSPISDDILFPPAPGSRTPRPPPTNNNNNNNNNIRPNLIVSESSLFEELVALGYEPGAVLFTLEITRNKANAIEILESDNAKRPLINITIVGTNDNNNNNSNRNSSNNNNNNRNIPAIKLPVHLDNNPIAHELLRMGYSINDISEALKRSSSIEAAVLFLLDRNNMTTVDAICKCSICFEDLPASQMYTLECCHSHRFCYPDLLRHIETALSNTESPHLPACPYANQKDVDMNDGCNYLITERELKQIIELASRVPKWDGAEPNFAELEKKSSSLYIIKAHRDNGHIRCSGCTGTNDEGFWFELPRGTARLLVTCPRCDTSFCGRCNSNPYHYHCNCNEVIQLSRAWMEWNNEGRQQYMSKLAKESQQHAAMLQQFNDRKEQFEREKKESEDRHQELVKSEEWMRQTCKMCPSCRKVVFKVDGCDSMVCGRNYHGGDQQNGCGASFNWSTAPAYEGNAGAAKKLEFNAEQPADLETVCHMIAEGHPMLCELCDKAIVGPRLHCINCNDFNMCVSCSMAGVHDPRHIFRVLFQDASISTNNNNNFDNDFPDFEEDLDF